MKTPGSCAYVRTEKEDVLKVVFEKLVTPLSEPYEQPVTVYGIRCYVETEAGEPRDTCVLSDISADERTVDRLIDMLVRGGVTPIHFKDIVEDAIAC